MLLAAGACAPAAALCLLSAVARTLPPPAGADLAAWRSWHAAQKLARRSASKARRRALSVRHACACMHGNSDTSDIIHAARLMIN